MHPAFVVSSIACVIIALAGCRWLNLKGLDAVSAGPLFSFLAVNVAAAFPSIFDVLNGTSWAAGLLFIAAAMSYSASKWRRQMSMETVSPKFPWLEVSLVSVVSCVALINQLVRPIVNFDDLMYHGSRAGYWMTNSSVFPFAVHNDRIVAFPVGGDLLFALGAMTAQAEGPGKFLVFLAYPLVLVQLIAITRLLAIQRGRAFLLVVAFATIPLVRDAAIGIKPDLWAVLFSLSAVYWFLQSRQTECAHQRYISWGLLIVAIACGLGVKWTVVPLLLLIPVAMGRMLCKRRVFAAVSILFLISLGIGGAGPALVRNLWIDHHPFGSAEFRAAHAPVGGWATLSVHLRRVPFMLFDLPMLPDEETWRWVDVRLNNIARSSGAMEVLEKEESGSWPGKFRPTVYMIGNRFSLLFIFILTGVMAAPFTYRKLVERREIAAITAVAGLAFLLFLSIILKMRWQSGAQLPDRFLLPSIALGIVVLAWLLDRLEFNRTILYATLGGCVLFHSIPYLLASERAVTTAMRTQWRSPKFFPAESEFRDAAPLIGSGRRILLFASQGARDYPLFDAKQGFSNNVFPWGHASFEAARFRTAITRHDIDTIVFEQSVPFLMHGHSDFNPMPFIEASEALVDFEKIPTPSQNVIFKRKPDPPSTGS